MKKHIKKSLPISILIFCFAVASAIGIYFSQINSAYAVDQNEPLKNEAVQSNQESVSAPNGHTLTTRIHLSTGDAFGGIIYDGVEAKDFVSWTGEEVVVYHDVYTVSVREFIPVEPGFDTENYTYVVISPIALDSPDPIYYIKLSKHFYTYFNATMTYTLDGSSADITLVVKPVYYICFNGNGGNFVNMYGEIISESQWIAQGQYNNIAVPLDDPVCEGKVFAGWYTDPIWGDRVDLNTQTSGLADPLILFAHWVDNERSVIFNFSSGGVFQIFHYDFISMSSTNDASYNDSYDSGDTSFYSVRIPAESEIFEYKIIHDDNKIYLELGWTTPDNIDNALIISPISDQRINSVSINGSDTNLFTNGTASMLYSQFNDVVISTGWASPGLINVVSDNGKLFDCVFSTGEEFYDTSKLTTDAFQIYVGENDYVQFWYGSEIFTEVIKYMFPDYSGAKFIIKITNLDGSSRYYAFGDNLFTLFDWFEINSYINGVNLDGETLFLSDHTYSLENSFHTFELQMSDHEVETTVTYDANGGAFADGEKSATFNVNYGEDLPTVSDPVLVDYDFVGWFTETEGGVQVDPANYQWKPSDKINGVKLYAHWIYNPQPVPPTPPGPGPEPVPPVPVPPTPDPVNPGGGGAQTGDSMPLAPIAALAIVAALCCCLALRKESSK